jgi:hypothetical protein
MHSSGTFRLQLRFVIVPGRSGDVEQAMGWACRVVSSVGIVADSSAQPYENPARSQMVSVEADCFGERRRIVENCVEAVGAIGWVVSGSGEEIEALWSPRKAVRPAFRACLFWMQIQTMPMRASPASRRKPPVRQAAN